MLSNAKPVIQCGSSHRIN